MIYLPILILIILFVLIIKFYKPKNKHSKDFVFDKVVNRKYKIYDQYEFIDSENYLNEADMEKYINSFTVEAEREFVRAFTENLIKKSFQKKEVPVFDEEGKPKKINGQFVKEKKMLYVARKEYILAFALNQTFPNDMVDLYLEDLLGVGAVRLRDSISKFCESNRSKMVEFDFHEGRYYSIITLRDLPMNTDLVKTGGIINVGSRFGLPLEWNFNKSPHGIISGETGGGKSVFVNYVLNQLLPQAEAYMVDFKGVDYTDSKKYFKEYHQTNYKDILELVKLFSDELSKAKEIMAEYNVKDYRLLPDDVRWKTQFLILEEVPSLSLELKAWRENEIKEKKYPIPFDPLLATPNTKKTGLPSKFASADYDFQSNLKKIILQGRAMGYQVIMIMQRADSDFIDTVIRDNCTFKAWIGSTKSNEMGVQMLGMRDMIVGLPPTISKKSAYVLLESKINYVEVPFYPEIEVEQTYDNT